MAAANWLTQDEDRAWRGWLAMSSLLRAQVGRDLHIECGLSEADFTVLVHLSEAPHGRLRMTELANVLGWSKSRTSHQISRMHSRGQVDREDCPNDARSSYAVLTGRGRDEIDRAAPLHVGSVRRHLIDVLDASQLEAMAEITNQVVAHLHHHRGACEPSAVDSSQTPCPTLGPPSDDGFCG
jgi:DNA-binding MarR family transcriptional regulator